MGGAVAAGVLLLGWAGLNQQDFSQFPQQYFLGGLIMVMIYRTCFTADDQYRPPKAR